VGEEDIRKVDVVWEHGEYQEAPNVVRACDTKAVACKGKAHTMSSVHVYDLSAHPSTHGLGSATCELVDDVVVIRVTGHGPHHITLAPHSISHFSRVVPLVSCFLHLY